MGRALSQSEQLRRGDLIFWEGHVAIVRDAETIVHANAHHMATAVENTRAAIARIKAAGSEVTSIKRLYSRSYCSPFVMAGLVPAIHVLASQTESKTWMPGTSPGMTT